VGDAGRKDIVYPTKLRAAARVLIGAEVVHADFETVLGKVVAGDFVFLDPPYVPDGVAEVSFVGYTADKFRDADHVRLRDAWGACDARGALMMQTNADVPRVHELYAGFRIERLQVRRSVGAGLGGNATAGEIIIRNY
jgi:DNA adenine methylase